MSESSIVVAGVDVGGEKKGFHAVTLCGDQVGRFASCDPLRVVKWCREAGAQLIGVDAPCGWCIEGKGRPAERELKDRGIQSFWSPTESEAINHRLDFYGWMLNGAKLYADLRQHYPLYDGSPASGRICFETFPHAVIWALNGGRVPAKGKATSRREILVRQGVDISSLKNIDLVDAALCAWAARCLLLGKVDRFGEAATGYIVTPPMPERPRQ